jgi:hypothetical protein
VEGDVTLAAHVTYFVRDIVPFLQKMQDAARRRVILFIASPPPPHRASKLYGRVFGQDQVRVPAKEELLPVLWEMGILPEVRLLPGAIVPPGPNPPTREEAIEAAARTVMLGMNGAKDAEVRGAVDNNFDEFFRQVPGGFEPLYNEILRGLLISWETRPS